MEPRPNPQTRILTSALAFLVVGLTALPGAAAGATGVDDPGLVHLARGELRDTGAEGLFGSTVWSVVEAAEDVESNATCSSYHKDQPGGHIAITGRGDFTEGVWADWFNGCGNEGCDDYLTGEFVSNGRVWRFGLFEHTFVDYNLCLVDCYFESTSGTIWSDDYHGNAFLYSAQDKVHFSCGDSYDPNGWQFSGWVHYRRLG